MELCSPGPEEWLLCELYMPPARSNRGPVPWFLHLLATEPRTKIKKKGRTRTRRVPGYHACKAQWFPFCWKRAILISTAREFHLLGLGTRCSGIPFRTIDRGRLYREVGIRMANKFLNGAQVRCRLFRTTCCFKGTRHGVLMSMYLR